MGVLGFYCLEGLEIGVMSVGVVEGAVGELLDIGNILPTDPHTISLHNNPIASPISLPLARQPKLLQQTPHSIAIQLHPWHGNRFGK